MIIFSGNLRVGLRLLPTSLYAQYIKIADNKALDRSLHPLKTGRDSIFQKPGYLKDYGGPSPCD